MSRQDKLDLPEIDNVLPNASADDDRLHVDISLGIEDVTAAEEEKQHFAPRRPPNRAALISLAYEIYTARRARHDNFDGELFGEPAWDMLLALYSLPARGEVLTVSSLCMAAQVPESTGLRWQNLLRKKGLIACGPCVAQGRELFVGLTRRGCALMEGYLEQLLHCDSLSIKQD